MVMEGATCVCLFKGATSSVVREPEIPVPVLRGETVKILSVKQTDMPWEGL